MRTAFLTLLAVALAIAFIPLATFASDQQANAPNGSFNEAIDLQAINTEQPNSDIGILTAFYGNLAQSGWTTGFVNPPTLEEAITTTLICPNNPAIMASNIDLILSMYDDILYAAAAPSYWPRQDADIDEVSMNLKMPNDAAIMAAIT